MKLPIDPENRLALFSPWQRFTKRSFDIGLGVLLGILLGLPTLFMIILASRSTNSSGLFVQQRAGQYGVPFKMYKIRSMRVDPDILSSVTAGDDPRITPFGKFLRKTKMDEFPQLLNVLRGEMSFVGPRPELISVYEKTDIEGLEKVLCLKPGITSQAAVDARDEEELLKTVDDPEKFNLEVLVPEKISKNLDYIENYSLFTDLRIIAKTVFG